MESIALFAHLANLLRVLRYVVEDTAALGQLRTTLVREGRDGRPWLVRHHRRAEAYARSLLDPAAVPIVERRAERADLVQIALPSGKRLVGIVIDIGDDKVRISDPELETGRATLTRFVRPIDVAALRPRNNAR